MITDYLQIQLHRIDNQEEWKTNRKTLIKSLFSIKKSDNMDDPTELDIYCERNRPPCTPSRQLTIHVAVMALAGVVYLGLRGLAGYYIGKARK